MKKLLLGTAVVALAVAAAPTSAQAQLELDLGGHMKLYGFYTDQDDDVAAGFGEARDFDIIRDTEIHFGGETTLDNGLTVGVHFETEADGEESLDVQESYAYFSGGWGRVNVGAEDGAAYLLQVAAPSADENLDGIRQYVNPVNYPAVDPSNVIFTSAGLLGPAIGAVGVGGFDYDQDGTGYADKITYLSPVFNGFQVGVSYTPDVADAATEDALNFDDADDAFGEAYEIGARYEGTFNEVGVTLGGGYTHIELESDGFVGAGPEDDRVQWNGGIDLDIGPFGVGVAYMEDDFGEVFGGGDEETLVVGVDYTTGPFKIGASYLEQDNSFGLNGVETERYTGGVVYTYGPGMTFRGSISYIEHDGVDALTSAANDDEIDATSFLLGTQINF